jgi:Xaa-Pro aminopeptidase
MPLIRAGSTAVGDPPPWQIPPLLGGKAMGEALVPREDREATMTVSEYRRRVSAIQAELKRRGLNAIVAIKPEHVRYISGFWGYSTRTEYAGPRRLIAAVVPASGDCTLIVPKIELLFAQRRTWMKDVRHHVEWEQQDEVFGGIALLQRVLHEKGIRGRIGIEHGFVSVRLHAHLREALSGVALEDATDLVEGLRIIKSSEEIAILRIGGRMAVKEYLAEASMIRAGVKEFEIAMRGRDVASELFAARLTDGRNRVPIDHPVVDGPQILTSGPRLDMVHAIATTRTVRASDMVLLDLCRLPQYENYRIGFSRNVSLRKPRADEAEKFRLGLEAYRIAVQLVRPGTPAEAPDLEARAFLGKYGLADTFVHRTGRGVGLEAAERPEIGAGDKTPLRPGMVVTIEPSIYQADFAFHVEDTYLVTETGADCLTEVGRDLKVVPAGGGRTGKRTAGRVRTR